MPDADWWEALWPNPARVLTDAGLVTGASAVDLCAGDGWFTLPMARIARHVIAVDIDATLLDRARARLSDAGVNNCDFEVADAFDLQRLVAQPVDYVFLANAFHGVSEPTALSRVVAAVLAPSGTICDCELASAAKRENDDLRSTSRPKDRTENEHRLRRRRSLSHPASNYFTPPKSGHTTTPAFSRRYRQASGC